MDPVLRGTTSPALISAFILVLPYLDQRVQQVACFQSIGADFNSLKTLTHVCHGLKVALLKHVYKQERKVIRNLAAYSSERLNAREYLENDPFTANELSIHDIPASAKDSAQSLREVFIRIQLKYAAAIADFFPLEPIGEELRRIHLRFAAKSIFFSQIELVSKAILILNSEDSKRIEQEGIPYMAVTQNFEVALHCAKSLPEGNYEEVVKKIFDNMVFQNYRWLARQFPETKLLLENSK